MGRSGWTIALHAVGDAAPADDLAEAVARSLRDYWYHRLPVAHARAASSWLDHGDDALVAIAVDDAATAVRFWFDESVAWPSSLGDHWVRRGLAEGLHVLDQRLAELGRVVSDPRALAAHAARSPRFFARGDEVGMILSDATVEWQLGREGVSAWSELEPELQRSLARDGRCRCPMCAGRHPAASEARDRPGITVEHAWSSFELGHAIHLHAAGDRRVLVVESLDRRWLLGRAAAGAPWRTVLPPSRGSTAFVLSIGERCVIASRDAEGAGAIRLDSSADGGATWRTAAGTGLPAGQELEFFAGAAPPAVFAAGGGTLHRSDDGGASWRAVSAAAPAPCERLAQAPRDPARLYAAGDRGLARSDDGGATWTALALPVRFWVAAIVIGDDPDVVACFGALLDEDDDTRAAGMLRSPDGGSTWAVDTGADGEEHVHACRSAGGRWFWSTDERARWSADAGATWRDFPVDLFHLVVEDSDGDLHVAAGDQLVVLSR